MAIFVDDIPYMLTQTKRVFLPKYGEEGKIGYGNLIYLFTNSIEESIKIMNNTQMLYNDNKYKYYYYNLYYTGTIKGRRYYIRNLDDRKNAYEMVARATNIVGHPLTGLNKTRGRNTYFELCKYFEIYKYITKNFTPLTRIELFWTFFKSIMFSESTSTHSKKYLVIDIDMFPSYKVGRVKDNMDNPVFLIYFTLYKRPDLFKDLDLDILIYSKNKILKINPSKFDKKSLAEFKREINKVYTKYTFNDESELDKEIQKDEIKQIINKKYGFTGNTEDKSIVTDTKEKPVTKEVKPESISKIEEKIEKKIDETLDKKEEIQDSLELNHTDEILKEVLDNEIRQIKDEAIQDSTVEEIEDDAELAEEIYEAIKKQKVPTKPTNTARDNKLREVQRKAIEKISPKELEEINASKKLVPVTDISSNVTTINENMKEVKFANLNKDYIENYMQKDIIDSFKHLNNNKSPFYIHDIKVEDSSNELNYKDTYKVTLRDEKEQFHTVTVDIPKFIDNKFMYIGGNKKIINRQIYYHPVIKSKPHEVQIVTNFNKMFIRRVGTKFSFVERLTKLISTNEEALKYFTVGNNDRINSFYLSTLEYAELGKILTSFETDKCKLFFNQKEALEYAEDAGFEIFENEIFVGVIDGKPIWIDPDKQVTTDNKTIVDLIYENLPKELKSSIERKAANKKLMYTEVTIMAQKISLGILLMYWEGLVSLLKKLNVEYSFSEKRPSKLDTNENIIKFSDGYLVYKEDIASSLLLNGIRLLDTENYTLADYDGAEPYLPYFKKVYGKIAIINALTNFYEFLIDPITYEILNDINLPNDAVGLAIHANNLLADDSYNDENSQNTSRIRSVEIIPAILYYELSNAYLQYRNSSGKKKLSLKRNAVISQIIAQPTIEDYSTINPVAELERDRAVSYKGYRGVNLSESYNVQKRLFHETMKGTIAINTSADGNCGINRFLTMEPKITNARGYIDVPKSDNELKDVNVFAPSELLYPLGNTRDDTPRMAMGSKQSKHVIPTITSSPTLLTNGADEYVKHNLSSDFVIMAEEDGTVLDYDDKSKVMVIQYKSGKRRAFELDTTIVKNGAGGFFLSNKLITPYKKGDKFKKGDTVAYHEKFFKDDGVNGIRMNVGVLTKVAITSSYNTYEDTTMVTEKLSREGSTALTFKKPVVLGKNSNIYNMVKKGDTVEVGDILINFDTSFEDKDLNKLLSSLSDTNKELIEDSNRNIVKSKYSGVVKDIKIYSTVELEELSPTLQKIVKEYYGRIENKKKFVSKYDPKNPSVVKCGLLLNESTGVVEPDIYGVIKGEKVEDGILIEFYIEQVDRLGVGDKLAFFTALKGIVGEVIPEGLEPYSLYRPDEEVASIIPPSSIIKRKVPSINMTLAANKVVVELKRHILDIYHRK